MSLQNQRHCARAMARTGDSGRCRAGLYLSGFLPGARDTTGHKRAKPGIHRSFTVRLGVEWHKARPVTWTVVWIRGRRLLPSSDGTRGPYGGGRRTAPCRCTAFPAGPKAGSSPTSVSSANGSALPRPCGPQLYPWSRQSAPSNQSAPQKEVQEAVQDEVQQQPAPEVEPEVRQADEHGHFGSAAIWLGILAIGAALAAGIWVYRKSHRFAAYASAPSASRVRTEDLRSTTAGAPEAHFGPDSVAVLPLTNGGGDANSDYLSDGITESLIGNLAHVPQLRVKSRSSVFRYKGKDVDPQKAGKN